MNPGDRASRRFPLPLAVREALVAAAAIDESEAAQVYNYIAVLYSVIDALTEGSTRAPESALTVAEKTLALQSLILFKVGASKEEIAMTLQVYGDR